MSNGRTTGLLCVLVLAMAVLLLGGACYGMTVFNHLVPDGNAQGDDIQADWDTPVDPNVHWARVDDLNGTLGLDMVTTQATRLNDDVDRYESRLSSGTNIEPADRCEIVVIYRYPALSARGYLYAAAMTSEGYPWLDNFFFPRPTGMEWMSKTLETIDNLWDNSEVADWTMALVGSTGEAGHALQVDEVHVTYFDP